MNADTKHIDARTGITLCINSEATTIATALLATPVISGQDDRRKRQKKNLAERNAKQPTPDGPLVL